MNNAGLLMLLLRFRIDIHSYILKWTCFCFIFAYKTIPMRHYVQWAYPSYIQPRYSASQTWPDNVT